MKPETQEWLAGAEMDLSVAGVVAREHYWPAVVFHSHLALEKLLKALWVEHNTEGTPPRTHDLVLVAAQAGVALPEWQTFLADLSEQAVASRYASPDTFTADSANRYLEQVKELWQLLRPQLN